MRIILLNKCLGSRRHRVSPPPPPPPHLTRFAQQ